jgi:ABC-type branched-subunit amino acid transport system ATPase component
MNEYILTLERIQKRIGGIQVLSDITLSLRAGSIGAFIGPNGAGKTTIFNVLSGELVPDRGRVLFQGHDITGVPSWRIANLGIGKVFQDIRVFLGLTVKENVLAALHRNTDRSLIRAFLRRRTELYEVDEKAEAILEKVGLSKWSSQLAGTLSFGNLKLLAFARLIAGEFRFVLLDEPVAGVFPETIAKIEQLIMELSSKGVSVLFIEHDIQFVRALAKEVFVINQGTVFTHGSTRFAFDDPTVNELCLGLSV